MGLKKMESKTAFGKAVRGPVLLAALLFLFWGLSGCGAAREKVETDGRLNVVTTIFPYYDFVRQVAGDRVKLTLVVPAGMDSHSFEPTPADMITIQEADLLISNGGAMEHWLSQVLEATDTSGMKVLTMMDYVDVLEEELVEGMEDGDEGHSHDHSHPEDEDGRQMEIEYDEHIWTSPVNAMHIVEIIRDTLAEEDEANGDYYRQRAGGYLKELSGLDEAFRQVARDEKRNLFIVADKFPFRYLADTYGWSYLAAFSGCSTDTEPSARTIAYLIDKVREERIPAVYYLELSSHSTARVISEETGAGQLLLHSCHNVTRQEFDQGITYLQLMRQNVENLRQGLDE